jgi:hypothetical protein
MEIEWPRVDPQLRRIRADVARRLVMRLVVLTALILGVFFDRPAAAAFINENLITTAPAGYHVGFQNKGDDGRITEWVPAGQTVENWTEMVTVQVFYHLKVSPEAFMSNLETRWLRGCPGSDRALPIANTVENGYPTLVWLLSCPQNPASGKVEITWFKGVQGNDSFYVVQKAFRFAPSKEQITRWVGYLKAVHVCDSRLPEHACPQSKE